MGYPRQIYEKAWQTLDHRAGEARTRSASRRAEIAEKIPEILRIEREMALGAAGITKAVVTAPDRAAQLIEELGRQSLALQEQRRSLLTGQGYPPDYLEEQFGCPRCRDQGYVEQEMCSCLRELLEAEARAALHASMGAGACSFHNFSLDYYAEERESTGISPRGRMSEILTFCRRYAASFSPASESLLFLGSTGLGKTHLSLAIAAEVTRAGYGVVYSPVQKLMDTLEAGKFSYDAEKKEAYQSYMETVCTCDLLVLDDLGTEFATSFSTSALYHIINTRQVEGRPAIISTNLSVSEIEQKYSQRMVSRLICAFNVWQFVGRDIRYLKRI